MVENIAIYEMSTTGGAVDNNNEYYDSLQVKRTATAEEIRKAYKKRALQCHPDRPGGNEQTFRLVNEAYEVLSSVEKRAIYDQHGKAGLASGNNSAGAAGNPFAGMDPFNLFRQMFSDMDPSQMNQAQSQNAGRRVQRSHDIFFDLNLTFRELYDGCVKKLAVRRNRFCKLCTGRGTTSTDDITCIQCHGSGKQTIVQRTFIGNQSQQVQCTFCSGEGIKAPISMPKCPTCNGKRTVPERSIFEVKVDPGTAEGYQMVCAGEGDDSLRPGEGPGDVVLKVCSNGSGSSGTLPDGWSRIDQHLVFRLRATLADCVTGMVQTIQHPGKGPITFAIEQVIRPTLIVDNKLYAPWIIDGGGMPAWRDKPAGWLILLIEVVFPEMRVDQPEKVREVFGGVEPIVCNDATGGKVATEGNITTNEIARPPLAGNEQLLLQRMFDTGNGGSAEFQQQQQPQFFMHHPGGGGGPTFFQFSRH